MFRNTKDDDFTTRKLYSSFLMPVVELSGSSNECFQTFATGHFIYEREI